MNKKRKEGIWGLEIILLGLLRSLYLDSLCWGWRYRVVWVSIVLRVLRERKRMFVSLNLSFDLESIGLLIKALNLKCLWAKWLRDLIGIGVKFWALLRKLRLFWAEKSMKFNRIRGKLLMLLMWRLMLGRVNLLWGWKELMISLGLMWKGNMLNFSRIWMNCWGNRREYWRFLLGKEREMLKGFWKGILRRFGGFGMIWKRLLEGIWMKFKKKLRMEVEFVRRNLM